MRTSKNAYRNRLLETIERWKTLSASDEWVFTDFLKEMVETMPSHEAFDSIDETVDVLLAQENESVFMEVLETVIALARRSETTEVPRSINSKRTQLQHQADAFGAYSKTKLDELLRIYRIHGD